MDKEIKLIPDVKRKAAEFYGLAHESLKELNGFSNFVFYGERGGEPIILRIAPFSHRSVDLTFGELEFLNYLSDCGMSVAKPLPSIKGEMVEAVDDFVITSFEWLPGRRAEIAMESDAFYEGIGSFAGQMHRLSMKYKPVRRRKHWDQIETLTALKKHTPSDLHAKFEFIANEINALPREQGSYALIHGDLSVGNYMNYEDQPQIIDFDMCEYSWFTSEIAIPMFYEIPIPWVVNEQIRKDLTKRFYVNFMNGYFKHHSLSKEWLRTIPLFLNLRQAVVIAALYGGRDFNASDWSKWDDEALKFYLNNVRNDIPYIDFDFAGI